MGRDYFLVSNAMVIKKKGFSMWSSLMAIAKLVTF